MCYDFKVSMSWLSLYSVATARASLLALIFTSSSATRWIADLAGEEGREEGGTNLVTCDSSLSCDRYDSARWSTQYQPGLLSLEVWAADGGAVEQLGQID